MTLMEGTLWKWTNYLSGWQPRFFVLEVGVLAYYKSQEEVGRGSKGSIKMGCCEITVHPTDNVRIDLKIPPDQYIYLRAATSSERQQWLVALGTSKACIAQLQTNKQETDTESTKISQLKDRMQEMGMYRSLLLQQVNTIKLMCAEKEKSQDFNETATMLSATCDEFLKNLCDCMDLADSTFGSASDQSATPSKHAAFRRQILHESNRPHSPPTSPMSSVSSLSGSTLSGTPSGSTTSTSDNDRREAVAQPALSSHTISTNEHKTPSNNIPSNLNTTTSSKTSSSSVSTSSLDRQTKSPEPPPQYNGLPTFFSSAPHKFENVHIIENSGIATKSFLAACSSILPFFDVLGSTAFAPVKIDITGNIKKLSNKFDTDPKSFYTLQNMIYQEIKSSSCTAKNSATDALLWLKRALEFMNIFLAEVVKGSQDLGVAAGVAYEKSLRKYHGWVVRGVFALAVKAVPYRKDFLVALGTVDQTCAPSKDVLTHMKTMVNALGNLIKIINKFYRENKLDTDYTV